MSFAQIKLPLDATPRDVLRRGDAVRRLEQPEEVVLRQPGLARQPVEVEPLKTGRKGVGTFEVIVRGRAAHAGLEPEKGVNALIEAARQVLVIAGLDWNASTCRLFIFLTRTTWMPAPNPL